MSKKSRAQNSPINLKTYSDALYAIDYNEQPVDILEFITNDYYLGKSTENGRGIYDVWKRALVKIFDDDSNIFVVLTGAIGIGKSSIAVIILCYVIYRILCLKNPRQYLNLLSAGRLSVSFFNLTKNLGSSKGYLTLQSFLFKSPWFRQIAVRIIDGKEQTVQLPEIEFVLSSPMSQGFGTQGLDVLSGVLDEVDTPTVSIKQKLRVLQAYDSTYRRFQSRVVLKGKSLGRMIIVASKQDELSFINTFVAEKQNSGTALVFDIPVWDAKPKFFFSGEKFKVGIPGDAFRDPMILMPGDNILQLQKDGYEVIEVPVEYEEDFKQDIVHACRDIAGRSVAGTRRNKLFKSDIFVKECMTSEMINLFKRDTIEIGLKDDIDLMWFFDQGAVKFERTKPRYIHMDFGVTGDAMVLACSLVSDWEERNVILPDKTTGMKRVPIVATEWILRLKARPGDAIPIYKMRKFIIDLKHLGFNIRKFSADLKLASEDTFQILGAEGIDTEYRSMDRTDQGYISWCNLVYEKRWKCFHHQILYIEAKYLEHRDGKVDHPVKMLEIEFTEDGGTREVSMAGSKDVCISGDTKIILLSGKSVAIKDLVGQEFEVFSCLPDGTISVGQASNVHSNGIREDIVRVHLDNGKFVDCTLDHRFMLRDGSYREAKYLSSGDSLMPLYTSVSSKDSGFNMNGYHVIKQNATDKYEYTHALVAREVLGFTHTGKKKTRKVIHHIDFNKLNNASCNLKIMGWDDHLLLHNSFGESNMDRMWKDPEFRKRHKERSANLGKRTGKNNITQYNKSKKKIQKLKENGHYARLGHKVMSSLWDDSGFISRHSVRLREQNRRKIKEGTHRSQITKRNSLGQFAAEPSIELKKELLEKHKLNGRTSIRKLWQDPEFRKRHTERLKNRSKKPSEDKNYNHKVVKTERLPSCEVFDLTVQKYSNFALDAGIFVHNCDAVGGSVECCLSEPDNQIDVGTILQVMKNVIVRQEQPKNPFDLLSPTDGTGKKIIGDTSSIDLSSIIRRANQ